MAFTSLRIRLAAVALAVAGVLFLLYPATRPWHDETTVEGAIASMSSGAWVASHLFAMIGFILTPLGLLAVHHLVRDTGAERLAAIGVVVFWIGAGLTLPYFGAEDFGLHAIASYAAAGNPIDLLAVVEEFRFGAVAATMFLLGLLALGVGAVLWAIAIWRSEVLPRAAGVLAAVGFALFIPQFFAPAAIRIGHGVLLGAGLVWLGYAVWRAALRAA